MDRIMESIVIKVYAVNLLLKTKRRFMPGIDGIAFKKPLKINFYNQTYNQLLEQLKVKHMAFKLNSVKIGSNLQVLKRKDILSTSTEKLRFRLSHNSTGYLVNKLATKEWSFMKKDPITYVKLHSKFVKKLNNRLIYELLDSLKFYSISKYKSQEILKLKSFELNGKIKFLYLPTLRNRLFQL